jgi:hypothetical protein
MDQDTEPIILKNFMDAVRGLVDSVKEMLAASRLLRARIESNDEVTRLLRNRVERTEEYQKTLDQRLTRMENQDRQYRTTHPNA